MASPSSSAKLLHLLSRLSRAAAFTPSSSIQKSRLLSTSRSRYIYILEASNCAPANSLSYYPSRNFCSSSPSNLRDEESSQGPSPIDYSSILQEDEFHRLADSTIQELLEKIEEYGDTVDIDGFDIDYGNQVLTVKLGSLGTYVLNKQTPNRQIWMSSPLRNLATKSDAHQFLLMDAAMDFDGPSRFDWDRNAEAWVYRRNKANLSKLLEDELEKLCGKAISLS